MAKLMVMTQKAWYWVGLLLVCVGLEVGALFYQHVLGLLPCELCIYVRVWVLALTLVCLIGVLLKPYSIARAIASGSGFILTIGLASETWNLVKVEYGIGNGGSCGFFANFPSWAPLDKWIPAMFEVQELCQATPEIVFGITMTDSLIVVCVILLAAFLAAFIGATRRIASKE